MLLYHSFLDSHSRFFQCKLALHVPECRLQLLYTFDMNSPNSPFHCKHAVVKQIRYSQGTTEELRFFSLLLSLWALKHSTKRRLHWVRSWRETRQTEDQKIPILAPESIMILQQVFHINSKHVMLRGKWQYAQAISFSLLMLKEQELDETFIETWLSSD